MFKSVEQLKSKPDCGIDIGHERNQCLGKTSLGTLHHSLTLMLFLAATADADKQLLFCQLELSTSEALEQ